MHSEHHHFILEKSLHSKMNKIYFFQSILTFVKSLIGVFIPIYLFSLGISIPYILLYIAGTSMTYLLFAPLCVKLISKIGFKYIILISIPLYTLQLFALNQVETNVLYVNLIWLSYGLHMSFFWPAFHSEIALNGSSKKRSSEIGTLQTLTTLVSALAPFIGGFILEYFNYNSLLIFSIFLILIGLIPFFLSKDIKVKNLNFPYSRYWYFLSKKIKSNSKKAFFFEGIESILIHSIWPIILFVFLENNFFYLGSLLTVISLISIIFIVYFKKKLDSKDKHIFLKKTSKYLVINWFLRFLFIFLSSFLLIIVEGLFKLSKSIFSLSYLSIFYNNAKSWNYMDYILFREIFLHSAKIIISLLLFIIYTFFGFSTFFFYFVILLGIITPIGLSYLDKE